MLRLKLSCQFVTQSFMPLNINLKRLIHAVDSVGPIFNIENIVILILLILQHRGQNIIQLLFQSGLELIISCANFVVYSKIPRRIKIKRVQSTIYCLESFIAIVIDMSYSHGKCACSTVKKFYFLGDSHKFVRHSSRLAFKSGNVSCPPSLIQHLLPQIFINSFQFKNSSEGLILTRSSSFDKFVHLTTNFVLKMHPIQLLWKQNSQLKQL